MKNRLFDIMTLSSKQFLSEGENVEPITILTSGVAILSQIFPNIFGGNRKRLTEAMWLQLLPGAGYWTTSLRNYLQARIHYDVDYPKNVLQFTKDFVYERPGEVCGLKDWGGPASPKFAACYESFLAKLSDEKNTGGQSPIGITPGGYGMTTNYSALVPIALGALALIVVMKSKKKR